MKIRMEYKELKDYVKETNKDGKYYGFFRLIADSGQAHTMDKETLSLLLKEFDYAVSKAVDTETYNKIVDKVFDETDNDLA